MRGDLPGAGDLFESGPNDERTAAPIVVSAGRSARLKYFRMGLSGDQRLIDQMKAIGDKKQWQSERKKLFIHCHQAENQNGPSLRIRCLGRITENTILAAALSGFDELILVKGICSRCHLKQGEKLLTGSIEASRVLLESIGARDFPVSLMEKEKRHEESSKQERYFFENFSRCKG